MAIKTSLFLSVPQEMNLKTKVLLLAAAFLLVSCQPHTDAAIWLICNWFIIYLFVFAESYVFWDELNGIAKASRTWKTSALSANISSEVKCEPNKIELWWLITRWSTASCFYDNCKEHRWVMLFWANCIWTVLWTWIFI